MGDEDSQTFTVSSTYRKLLDATIFEEIVEFDKFWKVKALPSAQHFAWKNLLNKVATKDNLGRRGINITDSLCNMCRFVDESSSHLFFTCDVAMGVWNMCNKWVGVSNVNHFMPRQHFNHFYLFGLDSKQNNAWKWMWMSVVWVILKQRNNIIFSGGTVGNIEMFTVAQLKTWDG